MPRTADRRLRLVIVRLDDDELKSAGDQRARRLVSGIGLGRSTQVGEIVTLLRDDRLGAGRERDDLAPYEAAFEAIDRHPNHLSSWDASAVW